MHNWTRVFLYVDDCSLEITIVYVTLDLPRLSSYSALMHYYQGLSAQITWVFNRILK